MILHGPQEACAVLKTVIFWRMSIPIMTLFTAVIMTAASQKIPLPVIKTMAIWSQSTMGICFRQSPGTAKNTGQSTLCATPGCFQTLGRIRESPEASAGVCSITILIRISVAATGVCYHGVLDMFRNPKTAAFVYASQQRKTRCLRWPAPWTSVSILPEP